MRKPIRAFVALFTMIAATLAIACADDGVSEAAAMAGPAPDSFRVVFETTRGDVSVDILRAWSPKGADRFYALVLDRFFDDTRFFRVVPGFIVQFGLAANPKRNEHWDERIGDDSVKASNLRGTLTFATEGDSSRGHQLFFNLGENARLDRLGFSPIGRVAEGLPRLDSINAEYAESPDQHMIQTLGNSYLQRMFPRLDYIKTVRIDSVK